MSPNAQGLRRILRTTLVMGGASVSTLAVGIARTKILAVLLGPGGLGLLALLNSAMTTASALFGAGLGFSGVKQLAQAQSGSEAFFRIRSAMRWGSLWLGLVAALVIWGLREQLSRLLTGGDRHAFDVGMIGIGVVFSLLATSQTATLQGERRIAELAKLQVAAAVAGSVLAVACVLWLGSAGIVLAVIAPPIVGAACGYAFVRDRSDDLRRFMRWRENARELRLMMGIGLLFLLNSALAQASEMWVRGAIGRSLGLQALGQFQAAWSLSQYVALALAAMATEFLPRLAEAVRKSEPVHGLVDEQVSAAWALTTPVVLVALAFAPVVVPVLFSNAFTGALPVLKWQLPGDLLRMATVPLVYVLAVHDKKVLYVAIPALWHLAYVSGITLWAGRFGLEGVGAAYFVGNALYLVGAYVAVRASTGVGLSARTISIGVCGLVLALTTRALMDRDAAWAMAFAAVCALAWAFYHGRVLVTNSVQE